MEKKFLAIIAVSLWGHHFYKVINANQSVDSVIYVDFFTQLEHFLQNAFSFQIQMRNMSLIHDNVRLHTSNLTQQYLLNKVVRLLKQPPYSPDCNMCCLLYTSPSPRD